MASLKEIKERINSVKSTLKITSAMKLMSSAKYHKFSSMMVPLKEYRDELQSCLNELGAVGGDFLKREEKDSARCCVVAISSNSSLCGGFNTNIIKKAKAHTAAVNGFHILIDDGCNQLRLLIAAADGVEVIRSLLCLLDNFFRSFFSYCMVVGRTSIAMSWHPIIRTTIRIVVYRIAFFIITYA